MRYDAMEPVERQASRDFLMNDETFLSFLVFTQTTNTCLMVGK